MKIHNVVTVGSKRCELHACLRRVIRLCRWAGFFPVEGMDSPLTNHLRFSMKSAYGAYFVVSMVGQAVIAGCYLHTFVTSKLSLNTASNALFYVNSFLIGLLLLQLAQHWPSLVLKTKEIEQGITELLRISKNTPRKLKAVAYSLMLLALVEHILSVLHQLNVVKTCASEHDMLWPSFYKLRMPPTYQLLFPVTIWSTLFYEIVNCQATFLWNFMDVMIICFSMYLTEYFKELNKLITEHKHIIKTAAVWEKIRTTHCSLVSLVNIINSRISYSVLLAFFTDLFYICQQLFNTLSVTDLSVSNICANLESPKALYSLIKYVYYTYSFLFLVARVSVLLVVAANVNTVSQTPRMALGEVSAAVYNIGVLGLAHPAVSSDLAHIIIFSTSWGPRLRLRGSFIKLAQEIFQTQRFLRQINYTTIAISGWFFYVTRRMILKVAGTIITYELVLLQLR